MKKVSKFLVLLSAFGITLAGCGETKDSPKESQQPASTPATSVDAPSDESVQPAESVSPEQQSTPVEESSSDGVEVSEELQSAADFFYQIYKDKKTVVDSFDVIESVQGFKVNYEVEFVSGIEGLVSLSDLVPVEGKVGHYVVQVVYDVDHATEETKAILHAEIVGENGESVELEFELTVPVYKFSTYEDVVKAAQEKSDQVQNVKAYITERIDMSASAKTSMYLQDADGHGYYVYRPAISSEIKTNEDMEAAYPTGAEVIVSGKAVLYGGQVEFDSGSAVRLTGKTAEEAEVSLGYRNVTEAMKVAKSNKDNDALLDYQNARVEINNAKLGAIDGQYYYFTVDGGEARFNLYDTYYFLTEEERAALRAKWTAGYTATLKGILNVYSNEYQLYPDSVDSITITGTDLSNADIASVFFDSAKIPAQLTEDFQLPTAEGVAWTLETTEAAEIKDNVLVLKPQAEDTAITLTATYTFSEEESYTKDFDTVVKALKDEKVLSVAEILAEMAQYTDGQVSTDKFRVGGMVVSSTYKSNYGSYDIWLAGADGQPAFEIYSGVIADGITGDFTAADALKGYYVEAEGYAKLYGTTFELAYLGKNQSPTGQAESPKVFSVIDPQVGNGSEALPYSATRAVEVTTALEDNAIDDKISFVRGIVSKAEYRSKYGSYTIWLRNGDVEEGFELYSVKLAEGFDYSNNPEALVGKEVVCSGYLQKYVNANSGQVVPELAYLTSAKSPTGQEFTPIVSEINEVVAPVIPGTFGRYGDALKVEEFVSLDDGVYQVNDKTISWSKGAGSQWQCAVLTLEEGVAAGFTRFEYDVTLSESKIMLKLEGEGFTPVEKSIDATGKGYIDIPADADKIQKVVFFGDPNMENTEGMATINSLRFVDRTPATVADNGEVELQNGLPFDLGDRVYSVVANEDGSFNVDAAAESKSEWSCFGIRVAAPETLYNYVTFTVSGISEDSLLCKVENDAGGAPAVEMKIESLGEHSTVTLDLSQVNTSNPKNYLLVFFANPGSLEVQKGQIVVEKVQFHKNPVLTDPDTTDLGFEAEADLAKLEENADDIWTWPRAISNEQVKLGDSSLKITVRQDGGTWPRVGFGTYDLTNVKEISLWVYVDSDEGINTLGFKIGEDNNTIRTYELPGKTWTKIVYDASNITGEQMIRFVQAGGTYTNKANLYLDGFDLVGFEPTVTIAKSFITKLDAAGGDTAYASYNGEHDIDGFKFTSYQVLPQNNSNSYNLDSLQFQAKKGYLEFSGQYTKLVLVTYSSYDYDKNFTFYAGGQEVEATLTTADTELEDSKGNAVKQYTLTAEFEKAAENVTYKIEKTLDKSGAGYVTAIELYA